MALRRSAAIAALAVALTALFTPGASATGAPPTPVSSTETFAAGDACPFAIEVVTQGKGGFIDLPNNPQFFGIAPSPGLRITVTNVSDPNKTVTVNATGAFRFVDLPDGSFEILAGGHNFLYGEPEDGATALATTGPIAFHVVNGQIAEMDLSGARVRDLCEEVA